VSRAAIVIPARWGSTRFPGKPLHEIAGKPLIRHVWERCLASRKAALVVIATDDMRIAEAAFDFGAEVSLTKATHPSGTDRIAEVAGRLRQYGVVVNVQGDEPEMDPRLVDRLIGALDAERSLAMATAACPFTPDEDPANPNAVKVVCDRAGNALYFSRSRIPFDRDGAGQPVPLRHLGIYAYRRNFLLRYVKWRSTPLEESEKLEQLRALEHGAKIRVLEVKSAGIGVDTPADAIAAEARLAPR